MEIRLPQLAEGADSGTVVNLLVAVGDRVRKDQTLLELENQKAVAPIPSPAAGVVGQIHVRQGDVVSVGQLLVTLKEETPQETPAAGRAPSDAQRPPAARSGQAVAPPAADYRYASASGFPPPAPPSVRRMAKELGLDLTRVRGSAHGGRITLEDVRAYLHALQSRQPAAVSAAPAAVPDFSRWGPVKREPFTPLRQAIARAMVESWATIPHVTQFDEADVSGLQGLIKKFGPAYEKKGARLTLTLFVLRALAGLLKKYPRFNSSLDPAAKEIVLKDYVHIGIAVDTEAGLIVPVLRDAGKKSLLELAKGLQELAEKTRTRKVSFAELQGGSFTVSNQGGIGGGHFTPIIRPPEVAILGLGRAKPKLPLSLSYDHRVVDGADAARFIRDLVEALETFPESEVAI